MISGLLGPIIALLSQVAEFVNTEVMLNNINELKSLQLQLLAEEQKGYDSDDAKIEDLTAQIGVQVQAVQNEFTVFQNKGQNVNAPTVPAASTTAQ